MTQESASKTPDAEQRASTPEEERTFIKELNGAIDRELAVFSNLRESFLEGGATNAEVVLETMRDLELALRSIISNHIDELAGDPNTLLTPGEFSSFVLDVRRKLETFPPQPTGSNIEWGVPEKFGSDFFLSHVALYKRKLEELAKEHNVQLDTRHQTNSAAA